MNNSKLTLHSNYGTAYGNVVEAFLKSNNIPYERKILNMLKGEGQTPEYLKISPLGKIPAITEEDGYCLAESGSILKYLCNTRNLKDSLYPKDVKLRGKVDAYYDFFTLNIYTMTFEYIKAAITKDTKALEEVTKKVDDILEKIQKNFLGEKKFVVTNDEPTIGDFTTAYIIQLTKSVVKSMTISDKLSSYLDRVNAVFPKIKEQIQSNVKGLIEVAIALGMAKAEDFE